MAFKFNLTHLGSYRCRMSGRKWEKTLFPHSPKLLKDFREFVFLVNFFLGASHRLRLPVLHGQKADEIVFDSIRYTISANRNKPASGDVVDGSLRVQMMLFQVNSFDDDACVSGDTNTDRRCLMRANGIIRVHIASTKSTLSYGVMR